MTLDTKSFYSDYIITGIIECIGKRTVYPQFVVFKAALTEWERFDPARYRVYVHCRNDTQLDEAVMTFYYSEIMGKYDLPLVGMNHKLP